MIGKFMFDAFGKITRDSKREDISLHCHRSLNFSVLTYFAVLHSFASDFQISCKKAFDEKDSTSVYMQLIHLHYESP